MLPKADIALDYFRRDLAIPARLPEQIMIILSKAQLRAAAHLIEMRLHQPHVVAGHEALDEFLEAASAFGQPVPFLAVEKGKQRALPGLRGAAEMQARDRRRPWIDVGWQEAGHLRERVYKRTLARLDLADDRDLAILLL